MRILSRFLLCFFLSLPAYAQNPADTDGSKGARKQLATIIFAGLGGAVLGLSTLSFRGRPQDHLEVVAGGFAVGIIVGAIYSSYTITQDPTRLHGFNYKLKPKIEEQTGYLHKHIASQSPTWLNYSWTF